MHDEVATEDPEAVVAAAHPDVGGAGRVLQRVLDGEPLAPASRSVAAWDGRGDGGLGQAPVAEIGWVEVTRPRPRGRWPESRWADGTEPLWLARAARTADGGQQCVAGM